MQRILSVYDWQRIPANQGIVVKSDIPDQRLVKLRVNVPAPVALYLEVPDLEEPLFLARVETLDEIQFNVTGDYKLYASSGEFWVDTLDGTPAHVEAVEPDSFTVIAERQVQNPEFLIMERRMQENMERRMALLVAAVTGTIDKKDAEVEAARKALDEAMRKARERDAGSVSSDTQPAPATSGSGGESNAAN